jgi:transposase-like protein/predicted nucleic acid-binding Zn finger protein
MTDEQRSQKAIQILSDVNSIQKITKNYYRVLSQSKDKYYNVRKLQDADVWTCECPDFTYRLVKKDDKRCKHIMGVILLQESIDEQNKIEKIEKPKVCPKCYSTTVSKSGYRTVKGGIKRQRYICKQCRYKFILGENGFSKVSSDPKIIVESINMYMSGMSYRKIQNHIEMNQGMKISHATIYNWLIKYMGIIKEYVDAISPEFVSPDVWGVDEMVLNVKDTEPIPKKGFYDWMWSIIDPQTRFIIATEVSKRREVADARKIMNTGVKQTSGKPSYIITDSLRSYENAIKRELDARKTAHVRTKSLSEGFANRPIERYHNEIRERTRTMRGCGNDRSAQNFADNYRTYHNFVRKHSGLDGRTPAEAAGIDLGLGKNRIKDLIQASTKESNFVTQLGKRIDKVSIINEGDCIKVTCKGWIEKQTWREINDILRLNGFNWLSNGKDSCWMKPTD